MRPPCLLPISVLVSCLAAIKITSKSQRLTTKVWFSFTQSPMWSSGSLECRLMALLHYGLEIRVPSVTGFHYLRVFLSQPRGQGRESIEQNPNSKPLCPISDINHLFTFHSPEQITQPI